MMRRQIPNRKGMFEVDRQIMEAAGDQIGNVFSKRLLEFQPPQCRLDRDLPYASGTDKNRRARPENGLARPPAELIAVLQPPDQNVSVEQQIHYSNAESPENFGWQRRIEIVADPDFSFEHPQRHPEVLGFERHEPGHGFSRFCDDDLSDGRNFLHQTGKVRLGSVDVDRLRVHMDSTKSSLA